MYYNVSEVPGILKTSLRFNILRYLVLLQPYVQYRPLCPIYAKICQYSKISLLLAYSEICEQKSYLYAILWKIVTFMQFCVYCNDIYENEKNSTSNASWEILNRMLASYHGYRKNNIKNEKNIFHG